MNLFTRCLIASLFLLSPQIVTAQSRPVDRVPLCLQFPDSKTYVACTGVVPVDTATGNALSWDSIIRGSATTPTYVQETTRRSHWTESTTPVTANTSFVGQSRDDGSPVGGGASKWSNFSCFAWADQSGTLAIQASNDNTNWLTVQSQTWTANTSIYLVQPIFTKYWRCKITNGNTAQSALVVYSALGM